jgi:ankyrin repeat protein
MKKNNLVMLTVFFVFGLVAGDDFEVVKPSARKGFATDTSSDSINEIKNVDIEKLNERDSQGWPKLLKAVDKGDYLAAAELIRKGADVNGTNLKGWTPLMKAAMDGNKDIIVLLLENGADPLLVGNGGSTALKAAQMWVGSKNYNKDVVMLLEFAEYLSAKRISGEELSNMFIKLVSEGNLDKLKILLAGKDIDFDLNEISDFKIDSIKINYKDENGQTALHIAVQNSVPEMVRLLLKKGANAKILNDDGVDAYGLAILNNNSLIAKIISKFLDEKF